MIYQKIHSFWIKIYLKITFLLAFCEYVKQKEANRKSKLNFSPLCIFNVSYFHFHNKENWDFSISCFRFQFSITISMIASDCMHEREKEQLRTSERENPHPQNRVCGCIFIDSVSLFFPKIICNKNTTHWLAIYIFFSIKKCRVCTTTLVIN